MAIRVYSCVSCCLALTATVCFAQRGRDLAPLSDMDDDAGIHGRIENEPGTRMEGLFLEVRETGGGMARRLPVGPNGEFSIGGVNPSGNYILRVTNMQGDVIAEEMASPSTGEVLIHLPKLSGSKPPNGTVSLFELEHKVDPKALKMAGAADKTLAKTHDLHTYIDKIQKAVEIDPDYLGARRNLAVAYLKTGQNQKAIEQFKEVLKRDPHMAMAYAASSAAHLQLGQFAAAEECARRALAIEPEDEASRYYLGVSLQLQQKDDAEALGLLQNVAARYPRAHLSAAEILERTGQKGEARSQLHAYLDSGDKSVQQQVKAWLSSLN